MTVNKKKGMPILGLCLLYLGILWSSMPATWCRFLTVSVCLQPIFCCWWSCWSLTDYIWLTLMWNSTSKIVSFFSNNICKKNWLEHYIDTLDFYTVQQQSLHIKGVITKVCIFLGCPHKNLKFNSNCSLMLNVMNTNGVMFLGHSLIGFLTTYVSRID